MTPQTAPPWWQPDRFSRRKPYLAQRMAVIRAIRRYFDDQGFAEVETPVLQVCPAMDTHIHGFATDLRGVDLRVLKTMYLHTSPEFGMKKLLVAGMGAIYQICHVFRNAEGSRRHSPEFTMLEWYRTGVGYDAILQDMVGLMRAAAAAADTRVMRYDGHECDPFREPEILTVRAAFARYAAIELDAYLDDRAGFAAAIAAQGIRVADDDAWDDLFFRVMAEKIEPFLGMGAPTFLCDYPLCMASLARPCKDDPRYAARFEVYACGVELANAFDELTDVEIQRQRFKEEMDAKERIYGERYPVDEDFIDALAYGMPDSGGIAVGVDRLVMLVTGAANINDVLWAPVDMS